MKLHVRLQDKIVNIIRAPQERILVTVIVVILNILKPIYVYQMGRLKKLPNFAKKIVKLIEAHDANQKQKKQDGDCENDSDCQGSDYCYEENGTKTCIANSLMGGTLKNTSCENDQDCQGSDYCYEENGTKTCIANSLMGGTQKLTSCETDGDCEESEYCYEENDTKVCVAKNLIGSGSDPCMERVEDTCVHDCT
eukprot:UN22229